MTKNDGRRGDNGATGTGPSPCVSVVVPAYNVGPYVQETLASVEAQTMAGWEAIVVDDGSQDDTAAVARARTDPRIAYYFQENQGVSVARNAGLALARGTYTLFLDGDDVLLPDALARLTASLESHPGAVAAYGEAQPIDTAGQKLGDAHAPVFGTRPSGNVLAHIVRRNFVTTPGVLLARTATLRAIGGFVPGLRVAEDWECWCRLATQGDFAYLGADKPVLGYRHRTGSVVRSTGLSPEDAIACLRTALSDPRVRDGLGNSFRSVSRQGYASVYSFTATEHLRQGNWPAARRYLAKSLHADPCGLREWILLVFSTLGFLPTSIRQRLK